MSNDILGHDCDGKPLRKGDKAIFVEQPISGCIAEPRPITRQVVVTGLPGSNSLKPAAKSAVGQVEVDVADHDGDFMTCHPGKLRKVAEADLLCHSAMTEEEREIPAEEWKGKVGGSWNHGEDTELLRVARERMDDESVPLTIKQLRYLDAKGEDWIDEFARTATVDEFRGAMKFTLGKYLRRAGKKDDLTSEIEKMRDYCERWISYERSL